MASLSDNSAEKRLLTMTVQTWMISALTVLETAMLVFALYQLGFAEGQFGWAKLATIGLAAWLVGYLINRLAIERGVTLSAKGSKLAGPVSALSILLVGVTFFIATFSGLTKAQVEEFRLAEFLHVAGVYTDGRTAVADQAAELVPIMQAMAEDLSAQAAEEERSGRGPITQSLETLFGRANGLSEQMTVSLGARTGVQQEITDLRARMDATLADESVPIWDRRAALRQDYAQLLGLLAELDKAMPVSLVRSYTGELESGVLIPNRADASARINRTLSGYSQSLKSALEAQQGVAEAPPEFPSESGSMDAFAYVGKFTPVLMVTVLVDLVAPILVWAYAMMTFGVLMPKAPKAPRPKSDYDTILDTAPMSRIELEDAVLRDERINPTTKTSVRTRSRRSPEKK